MWHSGGTIRKLVFLDADVCLIHYDGLVKSSHSGVNRSLGQLEPIDTTGLWPPRMCHNSQM